MSSYDLSDDYDGDYFPQHTILCRSGWDGCQGAHSSAALVRQCFEAQRDGAWPCSWIVESYGEDGPYHLPCGAPTRYLDEAAGSYQCEAGHDYIPPEVRTAEGWEYAGDEGEARDLAFAGVEPRTMSGHVWPR